MNLWQEHFRMAQKMKSQSAIMCSGAFRKPDMQDMMKQPEIPERKKSLKIMQIFWAKLYMSAEENM